MATERLTDVWLIGTTWWQGFCETTASARLMLYLKRLYFISSAIAYCISPYASFYAGLSCYIFLSAFTMQLQIISRHVVLSSIFERECWSLFWLQYWSRFRRNTTHCILPYAIVMCVCMCVCVCVCVTVCVCLCRVCGPQENGLR